MLLWTIALNAFLMRDTEKTDLQSRNDKTCFKVSIQLFNAFFSSSDKSVTETLLASAGRLGDGCIRETFS